MEWTQATSLEHAGLVTAWLTVAVNIPVGMREWSRRASLIKQDRNGSARFAALAMLLMSFWRLLIALLMVRGSHLWLALPNTGYEDALELRQCWLAIVIAVLGKSIFDLWAGGRIHRIHDREYEGTAH